MVFVLVQINGFEKCVPCIDGVGDTLLLLLSLRNADSNVVGSVSIYCLC